MERPGWTWVKTTAEVAGLTFTLSLYGAWQDSPSPDPMSIPWHRALSEGSYQAIGAVLYGIISLNVPNGVWSRIRNVVARDKIEPKP